MANKSKDELAAEAQAKLDAENAAKLEAEAQAKLDAESSQEITPSLIKVIAIHDEKGDETKTLWGVAFKLEDEVYVAELSEEDADAMVKANRVKLA